MALVRGAPQLLVETDINGGLGYENRLGRTVALANRALAIPGFAPRLLASLVASSTAACTSGVVTVTATAHLIPATSFNGYSFYYPGSASLAAGWYSNFSRTGADTVTFSAPLSADFASESVNAGAAFTSEVTYESLVIPANTCVSGDRVSFPVWRASNSTAGTKTNRFKINSNTVTVASSVSTTSIIGASDFSFTFDSSTTAIGHTNNTGALGNTLTRVAADTATDLTITATGQISAAAMYLAVIIAKLRID